MNNNNNINKKENNTIQERFQHNKHLPTDVDLTLEFRVEGAEKHPIGAIVNDDSLIELSEFVI